MDKRIRSPNYPSISLRDAVDKVRRLAGAIGQRPADRGTVAIAIGYSGLSGASATTIAALYKYGLLGGRGDEICISERAAKILYPDDPKEQLAVLRDAALEPELFRELSERFGDNVQNEDMLRNYLLRNKFTPSAAESAISAYKETIEFVGGLRPVHDSPQQTSVVEPEMETSHVLTSTRATSASGSRLSDDLDEEKTNLDEGRVILVLPKNLSTESVEELDYWIQGVMRRMKRRAKASEDRS